MSSFNVSNLDRVFVNGVIFTHKDIETVVDTFYYKVQEDPILKVPFQSVHNWPEHIERLTHFWWTRFGGEPYMTAEYNPILKHYHAGFNDVLLERWLGLFHVVLKENLSEEQYRLWALISQRMGQGLARNNELYKESLSK